MASMRASETDLDSYTGCLDESTRELSGPRKALEGCKVCRERSELSTSHAIPWATGVAAPAATFSRKGFRTVKDTLATRAPRGASAGVIMGPPDRGMIARVVSIITFEMICPPLIHQCEASPKLSRYAESA